MNIESILLSQKFFANPSAQKSQVSMLRKCLNRRSLPKQPYFFHGFSGPPWKILRGSEAGQKRVRIRSGGGGVQGRVQRGQSGWAGSVAPPESLDGIGPWMALPRLLVWLPLQSLAVTFFFCFVQILGGKKLLKFLEKSRWNIFKRPELGVSKGGFLWGGQISIIGVGARTGCNN